MGWPWNAKAEIGNAADSPMTCCQRHESPAGVRGWEELLVRSARRARLVATLVLGAAVTLGGAASGASAKVDACQLVTTGELSAALNSTFQPGSPYVAGIGITCGYDGTGPVRGATVRIARGKQAQVAMTTSLKALRETLRSVHSDPPVKVAKLGKKAYFSLDRFIGEGGIVVLDGTTFIQVTAVVAPNTDTAFVAKAVLRQLAEQALARAKRQR